SPPFQQAARPGAVSFGRIAARLETGHGSLSESRNCVIAHASISMERLIWPKFAAPRNNNSARRKLQHYASGRTRDCAFQTSSAQLFNLCYASAGLGDNIMRDMLRRLGMQRLQEGDVA